MKAPPPCFAANPGKRRKFPSPTALPETARIMPIREFQDSVGLVELISEGFREA